MVMKGIESFKKVPFEVLLLLLFWFLFRFSHPDFQRYSENITMFCYCWIFYIFYIIIWFVIIIILFFFSFFWGGGGILISILLSLLDIATELKL